MTRIFPSVVAMFLFSFVVQAAEVNVMDELDPFAPNIESILKQLDAEQEAATGMPSHIEDNQSQMTKASCYRLSCRVWAQVNLSKQVIYIYVDGKYTAAYYVSSGIAGFDTPTFDTRPNGRIYDKYTSTKYPDGDYKGLGNMPYAVFISGGFAIHGTTEGNFKKLGTRASHGCIRMHPDAAEYYNKLVRYVGVKDAWITVEY